MRKNNSQIKFPHSLADRKNRESTNPKSFNSCSTYRRTREFRKISLGIFQSFFRGWNEEESFAQRHEIFHRFRFCQKYRRSGPRKLLSLFAYLARVYFSGTNLSRGKDLTSDRRICIIGLSKRNDENNFLEKVPGTARSVIRGIEVLRKKYHTRARVYIYMYRAKNRWWEERIMGRGRLSCIVSERSFHSGEKERKHINACTRTIDSWLIFLRFRVYLSILNGASNKVVALRGFGNFYSLFQFTEEKLRFATFFYSPCLSFCTELIIVSSNGIEFFLCWVYNTAESHFKTLNRNSSVSNSRIVRGLEKANVMLHEWLCT